VSRPQDKPTGPGQPTPAAAAGDAPREAPAATDDATTDDATTDAAEPEPAGPGTEKPGTHGEADGGTVGGTDGPALATGPADAAKPAKAAAEPASAAGPWQRLARAMRPRGTRSHLLIGVLCAALGFALVVQVRQSGQDELASLRQDDLVRLLDEVTQRAEQLDDEVTRLQQSRDELASGTGRAQAAQELAQERAASEGILSGRLPAQGPGVEIQIVDATDKLEASHLFNVLEELRNAGAEAVQVNDVRLVTSSAFVDGPEGIEVDGTRIDSPYRWVAIGDPATMDRALEIPGGALATVRTQGATATTERSDHLTVDATRRLAEPRYARPQEDGD
jgi:uncharacterized protein YlxW (UPF0749 family)